MTLTCEHDNLDHYRLYWYKQTKVDVGLTLLIFSAGQNMVENEAPFTTSKYKATRPEIKTSTLEIMKLETEDSALYYCATSTQYHTTAALLNNNHNSNTAPTTGGKMKHSSISVRIMM